MDETRHRGDRRRGQAHTLEAIVASLLLLSSIVFALQVTAVTPLTASTASQHIENQQQATTDGLLEAAAESGALKRAVLYWDESEGAFHDSGNLEYYVTESNVTRTTFGQMLTDTYTDRGIAFNVYVGYQTTSRDFREVRMIYRGEPSDNAITATKLLTVYDSDALVDASEEPTATDLSASTTFYADDVAPDPRHEVYNTLKIRVVVWRM